MIIEKLLLRPIVLFSQIFAFVLKYWKSILFLVALTDLLLYNFISDFSYKRDFEIAILILLVVCFVIKCIKEKIGNKE